MTEKLLGLEAIFMPQSNEKQQFKLTIAETMGQVTAKSKSLLRNIDKQFVFGFDFLAKYMCTIDAASRRLQIGQIPSIQKKESSRSK